MDNFDLSGKRIMVAGHRGMVGSALMRRLEGEPCETIGAGREEADLMRAEETEALLADIKPDAVIIAAAKVGGILANDSRPADFLYDNLMIAANLIHGANRADVDRLLFLGSSCIYPKHADQPIKESALLTGPLEPTNQWYAIAKIAGIKLVESYRLQYGRAYISAMPTNLYGPGDNFDLETSHVLPALIRKAHEAKLAGAKTLELWGTGTPKREFLHAGDCADALVHLLRHYDADEHINVGSGEDLSILELAGLVCETVGFNGEIVTDPSKPDGTPRKLMSADRLREMGWSPSIGLREGIAATYDWYLENVVTT
ncbi:MAG: GDP-L-fucose synthase [Sphingomonadaceae bacterium]|nr:GDP-L-fucose synthase [Sphingomonadaceae bacterium]